MKVIKSLNVGRSIFLKGRNNQHEMRFFKEYIFGHNLIIIAHNSKLPFTTETVKIWAMYKAFELMNSSFSSESTLERELKKFSQTSEP